MKLKGFKDAYTNYGSIHEVALEAAQFDNAFSGTPGIVFDEAGKRKLFKHVGIPSGFGMRTPDTLIAPIVQHKLTGLESSAYVDDNGAILDISDRGADVYGVTKAVEAVEMFMGKPMDDIDITDYSKVTGSEFAIYATLPTFEYSPNLNDPVRAGVSLVGNMVTNQMELAVFLERLACLNGAVVASNQKVIRKRIDTPVERFVEVNAGVLTDSIESIFAWVESLAQFRLQDNPTAQLQELAMKSGIGKRKFEAMFMEYMETNPVGGTLYDFWNIITANATHREYQEGQSPMVRHKALSVGGNFINVAKTLTTSSCFVCDKKAITLN